VETERKYLGANFLEIRNILESLRAVTEGAHYEGNIVLDTPEHSLRAAGSLLRLRRQLWAHGEKFKLTYKCLPSEAEMKALRHVKAREEFEVEISDGAMMLKIFEMLGYRQAVFYEKVRESWRLTLQGVSCEIDLDTLPFGRVVEIEAPPEIIARAASALALDKCRISLKNYYELNQEWRKAKRLPFSADMYFDKEEKEHIFAILGLSC